jgi:hypothetical protein
MAKVSFSSKREIRNRKTENGRNFLKQDFQDERIFRMDANATGSWKQESEFRRK